MKLFNHTTFFAFLLLFSPCIINAQELVRQVVSSSGGFEQENNVSISWTLGEITIHTLNDDEADIILTQGFHQPDTISNSGSTGVNGVEALGLKIFPNPVQQTLNIQLEKTPDAAIQVSLSDANGCVLKYEEMQGMNLEMHMGDLPNAMYMLIFSDGKSVYSKKVLKASK